MLTGCCEFRPSAAALWVNFPVNGAAIHCSYLFFFPGSPSIATTSLPTCAGSDDRQPSYPSAPDGPLLFRPG